MGPSQSVQGDPLFLKMESEDGIKGQAETSESEALRVGLAGLVGAIRAQMAMIQDQLAMQEWLSGKLECLAVALNQYHVLQEALLVALQNASQGFQVGLGLGLDAWAQMIPQEAWGGIMAMWEATSEEDEELE